MRWLIDFFKEYQLSAVLRERVSSAERARDEEKANAEALRLEVDELKREVEQLRSQIELDVDPSDLKQETCKVLIYLFRSDGENSDIGCMADALKIEQGIAQYHLDLLERHGLARLIGGNVIYGHVYWDLTSKGRRYVIEKGLLDQTN